MDIGISRRALSSVAPVQPEFKLEHHGEFYRILTFSTQKQYIDTHSDGFQFSDPVRLVRMCVWDSSYLLVAGCRLPRKTALRFSKMPKLIIFVAAGMLFLALAPLPYGYYQLLRIIVTITFAWAAIAAHGRNRNGLALSLAFFAILYNPLFTIHFDREVWEVINVGTAIFLIAVSRTVTGAKKSQEGSE